jgi:hypothetical protein
VEIDEVGRSGMTVLEPSRGNGVAVRGMKRTASDRLRP